VIVKIFCVFFGWLFSETILTKFPPPIKVGPLVAKLLRTLTPLVVTSKKTRIDKKARFEELGLWAGD
jgi:hypothetical protein